MQCEGLYIEEGKEDEEYVCPHGAVAVVELICGSCTQLHTYVSCPAHRDNLLAKPDAVITEIASLTKIGP